MQADQYERTRAGATAIQSARYQKGLADGVTFSRYLSTLQIERLSAHFLAIMLRYTTLWPLRICALAVFRGLTSCQLVVQAIRGTNM